MSDQYPGSPTPADRDSGPSGDFTDSSDPLSSVDSSRDPLSSESFQTHHDDAGSADAPPTAYESQIPPAPQGEQPTSQDPADQFAVPPIPAGPNGPAASSSMAAPVGEPATTASQGSGTGSGSKFSPLLKRILVIVLAIVVAIVARTAFSRTSADVLEVGQCVSRDGNDIAQVDCTDKAARYKVLFIRKDTLESSIDQLCGGIPAATASYFESKQGAKTGNIICLGSAK